jgi:hypothetical protein
MVFGLRHEHLGLVQRGADDIGCNRRDHAESEHAAPSDQQQQWGDEGRRQHTGLPARSHIGRHAGPLRGRPRLGDQRHADAELAAKTDVADAAVDQEIKIARTRRGR